MKNKYKGLKKAWLIKMTEEDILYNLEDNTIKNDFSKELNKVADIIKGFNEKK